MNLIGNELEILEFYSLQFMVYKYRSKVLL